MLAIQATASLVDDDAAIVPDFGVIVGKLDVLNVEYGSAADGGDTTLTD